jgi:plastocyanin
MKRKLFLILGGLCLGLFGNNPSRATIHTVTASDFVFTPSSLTMQLGDTIQWVWSSGMHTTTSSTIPSGALAWDMPLDAANTSYMYVPAVVGNYDYFCTPHASLNMDGSFMVVNPTSIPAVASNPFKLGPNPARDLFRIGSGNPSLRVELVDFLGKVISLNSIERSSEEQVYSLSGIVPGLYLVRMSTSSAIYSEKLYVLP